MTTVVNLSDQLIEIAKPYAVAEHRSVPEQIEHWARLGKAAEENPELPTHFIKNTLLAIAEEDATRRYRFCASKTQVLE